MKQLSLYFFLLASTLYGQQETANWYFGRNAGIRFNAINGTVSAVTDGRLRTLEGCSAISDRGGNLLFYTDGVIIFDRNHNVMQNGNNLSGDFSSTQSAIIVPKPNDLNIYYVFTVDEPHHLNIDNIPDNNDADDDQKNNGLNYSVVDMRLNNGNGAVVPGQKNIHLVTYDTGNSLEVAYKNSEKITAVRASDCESIWVITHFVDRFYSFKVDVNGVNSTPVVTQIAPEVPVNGYRRNAIGYLKASPDGSKLAIAHLGLATVTAGNATGKVLLYDFDNTTGVASNGLELYNDDSPYGIEFSPSGKRLYASIGLGIIGNLASKILQYDLESLDIAASQTIIWESDIFTAPAMQIGLDKKIYASQLNFNNNSTGKYLNRIDNPDALGAAVNFIENAVFLDIGNQNQHLSQIGLPPFIQSFFANKIDIILNGKSTSNLSLCEGDSFTLKAVEIPGAVYTWTKDDVLLPDTGFTINLLNVTTADVGIYRVSIDRQDGTCPIEGEASVQVVSLNKTQNAVLNQCDDNTDGLSVFNLDLAKSSISNGIQGLNIDFYLSLIDAQNQTNVLQSNIFQNTSNPQTIFARLFSVSAGCSIIREVVLNVASTTANDAILEACDDDGSEDGFHSFNLSNADSQVLNGLPAGLSVRYYLTSDDALLEQNALPTNFINTQTVSQILYARVNNGTACFAVSQLSLIVHPLPVIDTEDSLIFCLNSSSPILLAPGVPVNQFSNFTYLWSTGETTPTIQVSRAGTFTVQVFTGFGCFRTRTITVNPSNMATIEEVVVNDASDNNTVEIIVSGEGEYGFSIDNIAGPYQDSRLFERVPSGFHTVFVRDKNGCGIVSEQVAVIGIPKFFTPNGDGFHDTWQLKGLPLEFRSGTKIFIFDRFGKLLKDLSPNSAGWNGNYNGNRMPSTDYWYRIELADGRVFKGNFTLKR